MCSRVQAAPSGVLFAKPLGKLAFQGMTIETGIRK